MLTETFGYRTASTAALTGQVSDHLISSVGDFVFHTSYQYDQKGYITEYDYNTYVYDSQGQLIRENNSRASKIWTYQYDTAGNIVYKREYAYTTGELGTPISTSYRQFTDADWGDLMTVYNGTAITYDTIGNPLNDGTWTLPTSVTAGQKFSFNRHLNHRHFLKWRWSFFRGHTFEQSRSAKGIMTIAPNFDRKAPLAIQRGEKYDYIIQIKTPGG